MRAFSILTFASVHVFSTLTFAAVLSDPTDVFVVCKLNEYGGNHHYDAIMFSTLSCLSYMSYSQD